MGNVTMTRGVGEADIRRVKLSPQDMGLAAQIAHRRQHGKERYDSTRNLQANRHSTSYEVHLLGVKGELAVARHLGWQVDCSETAAGDGGVDFISGPWTIDAQAATHWDTHLKYDAKHPFRAHIAILVRLVEDDTLDILGWITKLDFDRFKRKENYGHGDREAVDGQSLLPIDNLIGFCSSNSPRQ